MTTELSIAIVSWNTRELLRDCLAALDAADLPRSTEIIVVDNASVDGSVAMVRTEFSNITVIANERNVGYARANNQALRRVSGRYVLLLNSDTRVSPPAIDVLMRFMDRCPQAGACAPRLITVDGEAQPYAFGGDPTLPYLLRRAAARALLRRGLHDWGRPGVQAVDWASGACLLIRRKALMAVGLLDETMFMYFEDVDWCLRARRQGWRIYVQPEAVVTHLGGQSLRLNPAARECYHRSLASFHAKHYGHASQALVEAGLWLYRHIGPHKDG